MHQFINAALLGPFHQPPFFSPLIANCIRDFPELRMQLRSQLKQVCQFILVPMIQILRFDTLQKTQPANTQKRSGERSMATFCSRHGRKVKQ